MPKSDQLCPPGPVMVMETSAQKLAGGMLSVTTSGPDSAQLRAKRGSRKIVRAMAHAIALRIPEADLNNVVLRLSAALTAMEGIEHELGTEMDKVEPVPPVYPNDEPQDLK